MVHHLSRGPLKDLDNFRRAKAKAQCVFASSVRGCAPSLPLHPPETSPWKEREREGEGPPILPGGGEESPSPACRTPGARRVPAPCAGPRPSGVGEAPPGTPSPARALGPLPSPAAELAPAHAHAAQHVQTRARGAGRAAGRHLAAPRGPSPSPHSRGASLPSSAGCWCWLERGLGVFGLACTNVHAARVHAIVSRP